VPVVVARILPWLIMLVTFNCPHCQAKIEADGELAGSRASCPNCERGLTIPSPRLATGDTLAGFRIKQWLGSGAMGEVYLANQQSMDREVALKVLASSAIKSREDVDRFMHEVRMLAKLDHPNIVTAFEAGQHDGHHYLAMTLVNGETLDDMLRKQGPLPEKEVLSVGLKVARALAYAWERFQLLHRDVKPSNIMIDRTGEVKLMDMGISKSLTEDHSLTNTGMVVGTPWYMSPEQAQGHDVDCRSDMYALGATLYHLLTGHPVHDGPSTMAILTKLLTEPVRPPREWRPDLSEATQDLLLRMLARNPTERAPNWGECINEFQQAIKGRPAHPAKGPKRKLVMGGVSHASQTPAAPEVTAAPAESSVGVLVAVFFVLLLAAAGGGAVWWMLREPPPEPPVVTPIPPLAVTPPVTPVTPVTPDPVAPPERDPVAGGSPGGDTQPPTTGGDIIAVTPLDDAVEQVARQMLVEARRRITLAPDDYDAALNERGRVLVMIEGTAVAADVRTQISGIERTRQAALERILGDLEQRAAPLLAERQFAAAAALYRDFPGPHQTLTAAKRAELAEVYEAQARVREAEETQALETLYDGLAQAVVRNDLAGAARLLQEAAQSPLLTYRPTDLQTLQGQVQAVLRVPEILRESFRAEAGQEVAVQLIRGRETVVIQGVEGSVIRAIKQVQAGGSVGRLGIQFQLNELAAAERLKRLERAGGEHLELYRGLLAVEARRYDLAQGNFSRVPGAFGAALTRQLENLSSELREAAADTAFRQMLRTLRLPADGPLDPNALLTAVDAQPWTERSIRDAQAAVTEFRRRYANAKLTADHQRLLDKLATLTLESWPTPGKGLLFAWENQKRGWPGAKAPTFNAYGRVQFGQHGEMRFGGGAYTAPEYNKVVFEACTQTNELTIGMFLTPAHLEQRGPARIFSYSEGSHARCFTLGQERERLVMRLRTSETGPNGSNPETTLPPVVAGQRLHVMVTYRQGQLRAYYNGELVVESDKIRGDFSRWTPMNLLFGNEWQGGRDWFGDLEGLAIYSVALSPEEVKRHYQLYLPKLRGRQ